MYWGAGNLHKGDDFEYGHEELTGDFEAVKDLDPKVQGRSTQKA